MNLLLFLLAIVAIGTHCAHAVANSNSSHEERKDLLHTSDARVYQSALQQSITITGTNFDSDLSLLLDPPLTVNMDYKLIVNSPAIAVLSLLPDKKWRSDAGPLVVRSIKNGEFEYALGGVTIATVLENPEIHYATVVTETESKSRQFKVSGAGFTNVRDMKLTPPRSVAGTPATAICITSVLNSRTLFAEYCAHDSNGVALPAPELLDIIAVDTGAGVVTEGFNVLLLLSMMIADDADDADAEGLGKESAYLDVYDHDEDSSLVEGSESGEDLDVFDH